MSIHVAPGTSGFSGARHRSWPVPEEVRLAVIRDYEVLDTPAEEDLDEIVALAALLFGAPTSLIAIVDEKRAFLKARYGWAAQELPGADLRLCSEVVSRGELVVVAGSEPETRSFAGAPLVTKEGIVLGTICVMDTAPREFSDDQTSGLRILANQVMAQLELRRSLARESRAQEALEEAVAIQDLFVSTAAHDLRGPFTSISGFAQMLRHSHEAMTAEHHALCNSAIAQADGRLRRVAANLSAVQRILAGPVPVDFRIVDLSALVKEWSKELLAELDADASDRVHLSLDSQVVLPVDQTMVRRMLENLLVNALDHGDGCVRVSLRGYASGAVLGVDDEGPGVTDGMRSLIFERYMRGPSPGAGGMGIGLFVVARFAQLHGGRSWVEDRTEGGAAFRVFLPATDRDVA